MLDFNSQQIISQHPIGSGLDEYRALVRTRCEAQGLQPAAFHMLNNESLKEIVIKLLLSLLSLPAAQSLPSRSSGGLFIALTKLLGSVHKENVDRGRLMPLLGAALDADSDSDSDQAVWEIVTKSVEESTPPPQTGAVASQQTPPEQKPASISQQTPSFVNSGSLMNTSEFRKDTDYVLNQELSNMYVNVPNFRQLYFGLDSHIAALVLERCTQGDDPLFSERWNGWPQNPEESHVLAWFSNLNTKLVELARSVDPALQLQRPLRLRTKPKEPIIGSTAKRMMDIGYVGIVDGDEAVDFKHHWSHVMIVGELKSSPGTDNRSGCWLHVARYAREVLAAQANRRFAFDRLGGIASERFDVNQNPLEFISSVLGFVMMNDEQLGYDPTIIKSGTQQYIEVRHDGQAERFILDKLIFRQACIVGRATTCWKAHHDEDDGEVKKVYVIKDSWQYPERSEEGLMLQEATINGVKNMAKYYHHEVVQVGGIDDDIRGNVRKGLDLTVATVSRPVDSEASSPAVSVQISNPNSLIAGQRETPAGQSSNAGGGRKRALSRVESRLHPRKRRSPMSTQTSRNDETGNRIHRRLIVQSYGKRIHEAGSPKALLAGLEDCINGHESLRREAGLLHRDISINNLMINEEEEDPSQRGFLIDLDLAIKEARTGASGAKRKTGTRAFMAIGALRGVQHSFMHDLESFFWVLYWICIHYDGPGISIGATEFEKWNYTNDRQLAWSKSGLVSDEYQFLDDAKRDFTEYYLPLLPWVNKLRKVVFPNGKPWTEPDEGLYARMKDILREARESQDL
ncbi:uncharacterized protein TRIVIDRAFT_214149 [Trichoderma virens Gv29-8]|uniref:non-specific serine/threonine protein kinase n=1 Tax=Hypocrea virens (strain Gv29-8 / FGSC 10586) TaxID=413071 RepID=G9N670_HYPVG|nr:uncharacterized protein TRIVIDRAFT_214149 [Trichoderma virens Gv29-8]EHK17632.1 hypothetical protein TRIVIDRAFT_214149 [Trichoderma virens Gv29-8]UKZ53652.1 hypothetical protein TrVGV298_007449 [Trichoderma virens]